MKHLALLEHERARVSSPDCATGVGADGRVRVEPRLFRRLARYDELRGRRDGRVFDWFLSSFKASQWVGVVQVAGLSVEILPKVTLPPATADDEKGRSAVEFARANLLYMLAYVGDLPLRERDLASLEPQRSPLTQTLIRIFAERLLAELLAGKEHGYCVREENLRTLKGKLRLPQHLATNMAHRERFYVTYDEFLPDTLLNQVLKTGCRTLLRASSSAKTQEKLRYCCLLLDDVADRRVSLEDFDRIVLTRQNERFADLLTFCELVLCEQSPSASSGDTRTFSLLFDMNAVFEAFVAEFTRREVMPAFPDYSIRPQARNDRRYLLGPLGGGRSRIALRPDILIKCRTAGGAGSAAVMDTKWKRVAAPGKGYSTVSPADYYQMVAYAQRYGARRSVLLFPRTNGEAEEDFHILGPDGESTGRQIGVRFLDLNVALTRREQRKRLAARLTQIVGDCLDCTARQPVGAEGGEST